MNAPTLRSVEEIAQDLAWHRARCGQFSEAEGPSQLAEVAAAVLFLMDYSERSLGVMRERVEQLSAEVVALKSQVESLL